MIGTGMKIARKLGALGLLIAIPLVGWLLVLAPLYQGYLETKIRLRETALLYARFKSVADQDQAVRAAAAVTPKDRSKSELAGASAAIVQATLQSTLQAIVSQSGVSFLSAQATAPKTEDGVSYQGLQLVLTGELGLIAESLRKIEAHQPYLLIDRIELRRQGVASEDEIYGPVALDVSMEVYAAHGSPPSESEPQN